MTAITTTGSLFLLCMRQSTMWNPPPSPSHIPDLSPVFLVGIWQQAVDTPLASALTLNPTLLPGEGQSCPGQGHGAW